MPLLIAVTEQAYTPEQLVDMLRDTYNMAVEKEDWKGMFQVIQLVLNYGIGKPIQRSIKAEVDADEVRRLLQGPSQEGADDDNGVIDLPPS